MLDPRDYSVKEQPLLIRILRKRIFWRFRVFHALLIFLAFVATKPSGVLHFLPFIFGAIDLNDKTANAQTLTGTATDVTTNLPAGLSGTTDAAGFVAASSQYLQTVSTAAALSPTAAISVEAWVKFTSTPSVGNAYHIIANWYDTENHYLLSLHNNGGTLRLRLLISNGVTTETFASNWTPTTNTWYHVAGTWQGSDKAWELVIDGSSVATGNGATVVAMPSNARKPAIGSNNTTPPSGDFHDGVIDDSRAWDIKRTAAQINTNKGVQLVGNETNLIGYWPFNALSAAPTVTTDSITNVAATSATGNGTVSSDGGATITERGFVYATTANPTTANGKVVVAGTTGAFSGAITGLTANTLYHVRAYATNSVGTSYGTDLSFTTSSATPTASLFTIRARNVGKTRALVDLLIATASDTIAERGVVYSTTPGSPTTSDTKVVSQDTSTSPSVQLTNLTSGTRYYIRGYVIIGSTTIYGNTITFVTATLEVAKHYLYKVYSATTGAYITTWTKEVFSEPSFKMNLNNGLGELTINLSRKYDNFGEGTDVSLNNKIEVYCIDEDNTDGIIIYQGYVSGYRPVIDEVSEHIQITIFSYVAEFQRIVLRDSSGNTSITYTDQDPAVILKSVIDKYRRLGGTINYSSTSILETNTTATYTFNTNTIRECIDAILSLCPAGWYWRVGPDNIIYLQPKSILADHVFTLGLNVEKLQTFRRIEDLVNRVLFTGGGSPQLYRVYDNTSSQSQYGLYVEKIINLQVTDAGTAQTISNALINNKKDPEIRSIFEIVDNNGPSQTKGYDIESIRPGHTLKVANLKTGVKTDTLWDIGIWDSDVWDQTIAAAAADVIEIISVSYAPDSIIIEASSRIPLIAKRIEEVNTNFENTITVDNPVAPS